jgi:adenine deaminase
MDKNRLKQRIEVASGKTEADLVIKNGIIVDVFTGETYEGDVAITDGAFVGVGNYTGKKEFDASGRYICPAFIDGHVHIESSMVSPREFAKVELLCGVTTIVADPHEIANVLGVKGIQLLLDTSDHLPFDFYFMLPSCVPATSFELAGATLEIEDLSPLFAHPRVLGLAEVMNFPAVKNAEESMLNKLYEAKRLNAKIDGHAAGLTEMDINVFMSAGVRTDHECTTAEDALARLRRGMYLMIREGTVARDLKKLLPVVNERNARRCLFVTDDKHLDDILHEGSIDYNVRLAISEGLDPLTAIQLATINTAECFGLQEKGAIAPGYDADFLLLDDLHSVSISHVFKAGNLMVEHGQLINFPENEPTDISSEYVKTVCFHNLSLEDLQLPITENKANIIEINKNSLVTNHVIEEVTVNEDGHFESSLEKDQCKLVVIERHHYTGEIGVGIVKGLGLRHGALASTVAHDSHNLVVAGTNDSDILFAAQTIKEMQGGLVVVRDGEVLASLHLPIAGLLSTGTYEEVYADLNHLTVALEEIGVGERFNPFLTVSFLSLPVIPEIKLTAQGLYDAKNQMHIPC